jgi:hypothetical protein
MNDAVIVPSFDDDGVRCRFAAGLSEADESEGIQKLE